MGIIEEFLDRYTKEYDFFDRAARLAAQKLEVELRAAGIRAIVTSRAKSIQRLHEKCVQREQRRGTRGDPPYSSVEEIFSDIVDLAGVRVALYFPAERDQIDGVVKRMFHVNFRKEFPEAVSHGGDRNSGEGGADYKKRFSGYSATHYRVRIKEQELGDAETRYGVAAIEIQVASVLMHAWSEVDHDLDYKPLAGSLSHDELAILDQLNGLVIAGEIALEQLQKAGEARVAASGRRFENHYELAVHLLSRMSNITGEPVSESGLGQVDVLFDFLAILDLDTPGQLEAYLDAININFERRPLAEQIVDSLLAEEPSRYGTFDSLLTSRGWIYGRAELADRTSHEQFGLFMEKWVRLERFIREYGQKRGSRKPVVLPGRDLWRMGLLPEDLVAEYDQIRRMRNYLVHGVEPFSTVNLVEAVRQLEVIGDEVIRRLADRQGSEEEPESEEQ